MTKPKDGPRQHWWNGAKKHLEKKRAAAYAALIELEDAIFEQEDRVARRGEPS